MSGKNSKLFLESSESKTKNENVFYERSCGMSNIMKNKIISPSKYRLAKITFILTFNVKMIYLFISYGNYIRPVYKYHTKINKIGNHNEIKV